MGDLIFQHYYLSCLAHGSFLVGHNGNGYIIDPRRDVDMYLEELEKYSLELKGVLLTHLHADFVAGHVELHLRTGAPIYVESSAPVEFDCIRLKDGDELSISSKYCIKILGTPGHTPESICFLLEELMEGEERSEPIPLKVFTGDTLFVGSTGRPDLLGAVGHKAEDLASMLFDSLHSKLLTLPDSVEVYPAHGPGSPCGKSLGGALSSTIGKERKSNDALQIKDKEVFIQYVTSDQPHAPQYFLNAALLNRTFVPKAEDAICDLVDPEEFHKLMMEEKEDGKKKYLLFDTRLADQYSAGHIPGAVNFPQGLLGGEELAPEDGNFAIWVGTLIAPDENLLLIADNEEKVRETCIRLGRIGYHDHIVAALKGGMDAWEKTGYGVEIDERVILNPVIVAENKEEALDYLTKGQIVVDCRTSGEYEFNHLKGAINIPLHTLSNVIAEGTLEKEASYTMYCVTGFRSTIAKSFLLKHGYKVRDVKMGFVSIWDNFADHCKLHTYRCAASKAAAEAKE